MDPRSDIYSLGATLHHLISGRDPRQFPPFTFPPLSEAVPDIDPALDEAIARAVSLQVDARFASAREFGEALAGSGIARPAGKKTHPAPRTAKRPHPPALPPSTPPPPSHPSPQTAKRPHPARLMPTPDPLHPPLPQPPRQVSVTTDQLRWPDVCACCCQTADTSFVVKYFRWRGRQGGYQTWQVPYCSACKSHAAANEQERALRKMPWISCAVTLCLVMAALFGILTWGAVLICTAFVLLALFTSVVQREKARPIRQPSCGDAGDPVIYRDCDPVHEFNFSNGAYAEMFAQANADHIC
jgi:hypothetical protein